jgi:SAM-dependent methyltransferase
MEMQPISCNFCGSSDATNMVILKDIRLNLAGIWNLVRCNQCGLFYLNPSPTWDELISHYSPSYHCFTSAIEDNPSKFTRWAQQVGLSRRCRSVIRHKRSGHLLDVGCATGNFLNEMRRYKDWQVTGLEPVASAARFARQRFNLNVFIGTLTEAAFPETSFDIVTLWDVLEHSADPKAYLLEIFRILKPEGWIVLKLPDPTSWEARLFGSAWVGFEAPQHLYGFPAPVLERELNEIGFRRIEITWMGNDYATFMISLGIWLSERGRIQSGRITKALAGSATARLLSAPVFWLLRSLGYGSSQLFFAQKLSNS